MFFDNIVGFSTNRRMIIYMVNISIFVCFIISDWDKIEIFDEFFDSNFRFIDENIMKMEELDSF